MKIAYILFDGITWLDFIGIYDPISRLKSLGYIPYLSWDTCAFTPTVSDNFGLALVPSKIRQSLENYDAVIVPGGWGTRKLRLDNDFMDWIKTARSAKYKISVCTGSLMLGAAGFLKDKKATTNYQEYGTLRPYCKEVLAEKIVEDGDAVTAGAVSASIHLGLYLCGKWAGKEAQNDIRKRMGISFSEK